jgi:steroid delta-isomerase-like uncharacterized protein
MTTTDAKVIVRMNTEEVQGHGNWALFDQLFATNFVDHTPQPGIPATKAGVLTLYQGLRAAFPDLHAKIDWQSVEGDLVTTYKVYHGTHRGMLFGIPATDRAVNFETVDAMRVQDGKITDHWGVANLYSLFQQLSGEDGPSLA